MSVIEQELKSLIAEQSGGREGLPAAGSDEVYIRRALNFCPKLSRLYIQNLLDENFIRIRRNADLARLIAEAKLRDERAAEIAFEEEKEEKRAAIKAFWAEREVTARKDRERVTLGEYYPAFAPGCKKTKIASDWYDDDDRWEKAEENYSADRRLTGQFLWNRGLVNEEYYGAGRCSSWYKTDDELEITYAEANRAAKIYKRRRFSGG